MVPAQAARRQRIRLINPNSPLSNITMPGIIRSMTFTRRALFAPTGLTICAAVMPRPWDVELVDECVLDRLHRPMADVDLVGVSAMTTQAPRAYQIADEYRRLGVTVVMGGIHPSALPEEALQHSDVVCKGDAESTLPHLIADWEAALARGADPRSALQRVYDWAAFETAPIATPRKDVLDARAYLIANPIQTTRGCPHNCNFCTTPGVFGRKFRQRAIADIVEEIRAAKEQHRAWCYIFADDNFGGNHQWAIELCEALRPLKVSWATQCDVLISRNDRLLRAMRASGCVGLILGLESPRQDTLAQAGKRFVQADSYVSRIRKIQSFGIGLWGAFIFGFDTDTWQDCMQACRFAEQARLAMSCFPILTPYPGTAFYEQFEREGRIRTRDWVVFEPKQMTSKQLRQAQMAAFAEFYTPGSARRRLGLFPLKSRAWVANLACWKGIHYYYRRKGRQVPAFADFLDLRSRAWEYPDEAWAHEAGPARLGTSRGGDATANTPVDTEHPTAAGTAALETLAARAVMAGDPLLHAALALDRGRAGPHAAPEDSNLENP
jgi:radical SAM superfamily enzyme YgiQ (UPF0313 family)